MSDNKNKITFKQIVAWIGIVILVLLYILTLIFAIFDRSKTQIMFMMSLAFSLAMPVLVWICTWLYDKMKADAKANEKLREELEKNYVEPEEQKKWSHA